MQHLALWFVLLALVLVGLLTAPATGPAPAPAAARGFRELQLLILEPGRRGAAQRARATARWPGSLRVVTAAQLGPGLALAAHHALVLLPRWDERALEVAAGSGALFSHGVPGCRPCELWTDRCRAPGPLPFLKGPGLVCPDPRLLLLAGRRLRGLLPFLTETPAASALLGLAAHAEKLLVRPLAVLLATDPRGLEISGASESEIAEEQRRVLGEGAPLKFDVRGMRLTPGSLRAP